MYKKQLLRCCSVFLIVFSLLFLFLKNNECSAQGSSEARTFFQQGEHYRKAKHYSQAVASYKKAYKAEPTNPTFLIQLGRCYYILKEYDNAIYCFEKAVKLAPGQTNLYDAIAKMYLKKNRLQKAVKYFDLAASHSKGRKRIDYKVQIAKLLFGKSLYKEAEPHLKEAVRLAPNDPEVLFLAGKFFNLYGEYTEAEKLMRKAVERLEGAGEKETAKFYYQLGYALYKTEQYEEAGKYLAQANYGPYRNFVMKMTPEYHYRMAKAYFDIYDHDRSKEMLLQAVKIKGDFAPAYDFLARIDKAGMDSREGLIYKEKKVMLENEMLRKAAFSEELARDALRSGNNDKAIKYADMCLSVKPGQYTAKFLKAIAHFKRGELNESLLLFDQILDFKGLDNENRSRYSFCYGLILRESGQRKRSEQYFKKVSTRPYSYAADYEMSRAD